MSLKNENGKREYTPERKDSFVKYIKEKQQQVVIRYKKEEYDNVIKPGIDKSGMKQATFIKAAIKEKLERDKLI